MKLLLVSIACPPKKDPECLQVAKYLKYLTKSDDLSIDILTTSSPTLFMPYDSSLEKYLTGVNKIYYLKAWENKYLNFLIRNTYFKRIQFPDSKFLFHYQDKQALKLIDHNVDLIYSRSYPLSSAILAYKLKKALNIPWVMHLSDPWSLSPLHSYVSKLGQLHANTEQQCVLHADAVTFSSEKTLELYSEAYPGCCHKFHFSPNVYDIEDAKSSKIHFSGKLRIVHTGGLTGSRNPSGLFEALIKLYAKDPNVNNKLEIIFAGEVDRQSRAIFENCSLPFVKYIGSVSYDSALKLQRSAHILLLIDNNFEDEKKGVFFPSKILDYFLAKRRILAITSYNSETTNVLHNYLSSCFSHKEIDQIVEEISGALHQFKMKDSSYFVAERVPATYDAKKQSTKLKELFKRICKK